MREGGRKEGREREPGSRERKAGEREHEGKRNIQLPMGLYRMEDEMSQHKINP